MKKGASYFSLFLTALSFYGCYPVHTMENYDSKADYYMDANSAFEGEEVYVSLVRSDSTFYSQGASIHHDSISFVLSQEWVPKKIKRSDIKRAAYFNKDYNNLCAQIELNTGEFLNLEKLTMNADSTINYEVLNQRRATLPLKGIKTISYKNYWGIPVGLLVGTGLGLVTGAVLFAYEANKHIDENNGVHGIVGVHEDDPKYFAIPAVLGPVVGTVLGWTIGGQTTWEFNN